MNKKHIMLTEGELHNIVEDVVSNMLNGMGVNRQQQNQQAQYPQQSQQQQQQPQQQLQQNNNNQPLTEARFLQWNQALQGYLKNFGQYIAKIDNKLDYIINGGMSRFGKNGGFRGLNNY